MTLLLRDRLEGDLVIEVAFTGSSLDLGDRAEPAVRAAGLAEVARETGARPVLMHQVHGAEVNLVRSPSAPAARCDALATDTPGLALLVRAADCVPVLLADSAAGLVAAVHSGRPGVVAGVVPAAVARLQEMGATRLTAWVGPHVCGGCYEVPEAMREAVASAVPGTWATTSWGTPAVDLGAGVRAQLEAAGVRDVRDVAVCTREDAAWPSHRRDGDAATRFAGVVWMARP